MIPTSAAVDVLPTPCLESFSTLRCQVMTDTAAYRLGLTREEIVRLDLLPERTPPPGPILYSGGDSSVVQVTLVDGSIRTTSMGCIGIAEMFVPACQNDPHVTVKSIANGYRDVPEGSTPLPTAEPEAAAGAEPLRVDRLDIPIDHVGRYEVPLGVAVLPNGILTNARFGLVEPWPAHVTILGDDGVSLTVRSLEPDGAPFQNYYTHGWRTGTERVEAVLVFDVFRFDPGAVLSIKDVVVR
jgi:hypothetical protein